MATAQKKIQRIPDSTLNLVLAGDLVLSKCPNPDWSGLFKRYEKLFEYIANEPKPSRFIKYKFFSSIVLSAIAKKSEDSAKRQELYELKNKIYRNLAEENKDHLHFKYLSTRRFLVKEYCPKCTEKNSEQKLPRWNWRHCSHCNVDRKFFNVLAMLHEDKAFKACLFLSNDLCKEIKNIKVSKGELKDYSEGFTLNQLQYNNKNMSTFTYDSIVPLLKKLNILD